MLLKVVFSHVMLCTCLDGLQWLVPTLRTPNLDLEQLCLKSLHFPKYCCVAAAVAVFSVLVTPQVCFCQERYKSVSIWARSQSLMCVVQTLVLKTFVLVLYMFFIFMFSLLLSSSKLQLFFLSISLFSPLKRKGLQETWIH